MTAESTVETGSGLPAPAIPGVRLAAPLAEFLGIADRPTSRGQRTALVPATGPLARLVVAGALTTAVASLLGHEPSAGVAVVLAWWTLMFCSVPSPASMWSRGTSPAQLVRPAAALLVLCSAATLAPEVRSGPIQLTVLGTAAIGATGLVELLAAALHRVSRTTVVPESLVVVGSAEHVNAVATELARPATPRWQVVATCLPDADLGAALETADGTAARVAEAARHHDADGVLVLPTSGLGAADLRRLSWELEHDGRHFLVHTGLVDVARRRTAVLQEAGLDVLHVRPAARRGAGQTSKAVADRLAAAFLLLVLGPLLITIATAIRIDSRGGAIFKQTRVGRDGRLFTIYKFRTMTVEAETVKEALAVVNESDGVLFKIRIDPRITRFGRLLRKYSLDELPQLCNVLLGQMSLVGPRPALPQEVSQYTADPRRRLVVKPGITGLWQVSGRSDLSWEETVRLDVMYVDNWSIGLDLSILWRTVGAVALHRGAY